MSVLTSVTPKTNTERYADWVLRLGRLPLPVSPPRWPWQAAHLGAPSRKGCAVLPFPNQHERAIPARKEIS